MEKEREHIAMKNIEQNFDFLTEKQRIIYKAVQNGSTYKQICIEAGISYNTVRKCYLIAERRVQEHKIAEKFQGINDTQVIFSIVYGELLACIHTLLECKAVLEQELSKKRVYHESLLNQRLHDCISLLNEFEDLKEEISHKIQ